MLMGKVKMKMKIFRNILIFLLCFLFGFFISLYFFKEKEKKEDINYLINYYSTKYSVPNLLIKAIIETESTFNPYAIGKDARGNGVALGLMQIKYSTAKDLGFEGEPELLHIPEINLQYGIKYIAKLLELTKGNIPKALIMYNRGPGRIHQVKNIRIDDYVIKVNNNLIKKCLK